MRKVKNEFRSTYRPELQGATLSSLRKSVRNNEKQLCSPLEIIEVSNAEGLAQVRAEQEAIRLKNRKRQSARYFASLRK
jgi:hypothetical protein